MKANTNSTQTEASNGRQLVIEGKLIPVHFQELPVKEIVLDPDNPRIQHAVRQKFKNLAIKQEDLLNLIYEQPGVPELMVAIRDNGGLTDPIYVRPDGRVIEGNCRAVSFLKLGKAKSQDPAWKSIPAFIVPSISDRQVAILQGSQHVAGKNKWRAYEKIGHLHTMHTKLGMTPEDIAKALGLGRASSVKQDLLAYTAMTEKLLPKMGGANDLQKWSYVQEFYKNKHLVDYRNKSENVDEFMSMVAGGCFKKGEQVRHLHKILKVPAAVRALKKKDISAALDATSKVDPTVNSKLMRKLQNATESIKKMPAKELQQLLQEESSRAIFAQLVDAIREAGRAAKVKFA